MECVQNDLQQIEGSVTRRIGSRGILGDPLRRRRTRIERQFMTEETIRLREELLEVQQELARAKGSLVAWRSPLLQLAHQAEDLLVFQGNRTLIRCVRDGGASQEWRVLLDESDAIKSHPQYVTDD